jgi:AraC-like DNA-binding protein
MRADNSHHLVAAARRRALDTRARAVRALRRLEGAGRPVSFDTVAREAGVSRSWLYDQADLRAEITRLRGRSNTLPTSPPVPIRQRASDASLRRRLEAANQQLRRLRAENQRLREELALALGEVRTTARPDPAKPTTIGPCS